MAAPSRNDLQTDSFSGIAAELEIRLPASLLERFTALLVANPPLALLVEETFFGLEALFDLDFLLLYALEDERLRPVTGAGRGAMLEVEKSMKGIARAENRLWQALESGVAAFSADTELHPISADFDFLEAASLAVLPLPGANGAVRGALVLGRLQRAKVWALARQKTLIAASRIVAVCLERSLSQGFSASSEGVALSNLSRLLDGVHSEPELRQAALEVLRPHLAGVSLTWVRFGAAGLRVLEFDGNEALGAQLRASPLTADEGLLEAMRGDTTTCLAPLNSEASLAAFGVSACCVVPVDRSLALLALRQARQSEWSPTEKRLLNAASRTLTASLERLHALEALLDARARAEFLAGLSDALQTAQTAEQVCTTAMALLGPNVRAENILTLRLLPVAAQIRVISMGVWGEVPNLYSNHLRPEGVPLESTKLTKRVFETRMPYYDQGYTREKDPERSRVALGLEPIMDSQGNVLAVFSVGRHPNSGNWLPSERELLARAAATVGLALERAQVRFELESSRHRAQVLVKLSDSLSSAHTGEEVAEVAMGLLAKSLKALNIITLRIERRDSGTYLRNMGVWGELPEEYSGYFTAAGVNINLTRVSKQVVDTGRASYDTAFNDPGIVPLRERRVSIGLEPIKDSFGQVLAIFSVGRDPRVGPWTDQERDLMAQAASTIGLALERARNREEIENRARALEEKTAEMEAFVYSVSHDLKSPMVSLEGMSTLLEEAMRMGDASELAFFVQRLRANVQTMTGLVNGLLELSRVGRVDESVDTVDVGKVVQTVLSERAVPILIARITVDVAEDFPFVTYSPERFYQLISNLIGNAIKFFPDDHPAPRIEISWRTQEEVLEFMVADNGPGIPGHLKAKSLELFSRLNPRVEGTGVGLAMVKRILDLNDGYLRLEDTPGGGLTVIFTVPRSRWVR